MDDYPTTDKNGTTNDIVQFMHCGECLKELDGSVSPREYTHNEIGWTKDGLQVWCVRHEMNVIKLDFKGQKVERVA